MLNKKPSRSRFALAALAAIGFAMPALPSAAREFTPDDTKSASGYAAGKGCPGGMEGPNEAANPAAGKPQDKTWEARGIVMVAVPPSESQIMSALCPGKALGAKIEAGDLCPICEQLSRLDFSHKECKDMGSTGGPIVIEWECPEAGKKYPDEAVQPRHQMDGADQAAQNKPNIPCEDPEQLRSQLQFCTENRFLKQKAEECKNMIDQAWQQAAPELAKLLEGNQARNATRQNAELKYSENDYEKTRKKIRALIAATKEQQQKLAKYPAVMVDNLKHSKPPCFKDNKEAVQKTVDEIDRKIDEGMVALNAAEHLNMVAGGRAEELVGDYGYINDPDFARKHQKHVTSDITGLKEDARKRLAAGQTDGIVSQDNLADSRSADFERKKFPKHESEITKRSDSAFVGGAGYSLGLRRDIDPSGTFSARGSLTGGGNLGAAAKGGAGTAGSGGGKAGGADGSVGSVLWADPSGKGSMGDMKLLVEKSTAVTGVLPPAASGPAKGAAVAAGTGVVAIGEVTDGMAKADPAVGPAGVEGGRGPASLTNGSLELQGEMDLFQRVSRKYRSTELFRQAKRVTMGGPDTDGLELASVR